MLEGLCRDSVIITNIGMGESIDAQLKATGRDSWLEAGSLLALYHDLGTDELANRALKTFGNEQLPFKRFNANAPWYYLMVLSNNLFEAFKEDVTEAVLCRSMPTHSGASSSTRRVNWFVMPGSWL